MNLRPLENSSILSQKSKEYECHIMSIAISETGSGSQILVDETVKHLKVDAVRH